MSILRKILAPFSELYGAITSGRNKLYDKGLLKSTSFDTPVIVVGNLNVGGTGKSPQIEYLIRILQEDYKVAVLSRGYKRNSKGFVLADKQATPESIGDEPMQFYSKFKKVIVAVDANRVRGINNLKQLVQPEVILLDDAFQHRKVEAGFTILLTSYDQLYVDDKMLPAGNLRENIEGANRAQVIVVTKCPETLNEKEQFQIADRLQPEFYQTVFFSKIVYNEKIVSHKKEIAINDLHNYELVLVTGIANTDPLTDFLKGHKVKFQHLKYKDHHHFTRNDQNKIANTLNAIKSTKKLLLTTEKDYVRSFSDRDYVYYLPIKTVFLGHQEDFNSMIQKYVEQSSGDR